MSQQQHRPASQTQHAPSASAGASMSGLDNSAQNELLAMGNLPVLAPEDRAVTAWEVERVALLASADATSADLHAGNAMQGQAAALRIHVASLRLADSMYAHAPDESMILYRQTVMALGADVVATIAAAGAGGASLTFALLLQDVVLAEQGRILKPAGPEDSSLL